MSLWWGSKKGTSTTDPVEVDYRKALEKAAAELKTHQPVLRPLKPWETVAIGGGGGGGVGVGGSYGSYDSWKSVHDYEAMERKFRLLAETAQDVSGPRLLGPLQSLLSAGVPPFLKDLTREQLSDWLAVATQLTNYVNDEIDNREGANMQSVFDFSDD